MNKPLAVYDIGNVVECYVDDIAQIDPCGPITRIAFAAIQTDISSGTRARYVQVKLIVPTEMRRQLAMLLLSDIPQLTTDQGWTEEITAH